MPKQTTMKKILVFNDISALGNCSMSVNLPVFAHLGHNCMPIVTAHYSAQTGFGKFHVLPNEQVQVYAEDILQKTSADAVYVGFCQCTQTLEQVTNVVQKANNAFVLVDPIMGDNGKLYSVFNDDYVQTMKQLVKHADVITPNLTEACLLADISYEQVLSHQNEPTFLATVGKIFQDFLTQTGAKSAVITGVPCGELIGNVVLTSLGAKFVTNTRTNTNFSGTGDLFSSVLLGELLCACNLLQATQLSAIFVGNCASQTERTDPRFGVDFAHLLPTLK